MVRCGEWRPPRAHAARDTARGDCVGYGGDYTLISCLYTVLVLGNHYTHNGQFPIGNLDNM